MAGGFGACVAATASAIASNWALSLSSSITSRSSVSFRSGGVRLNPLAFEIGS